MRTTIAIFFLFIIMLSCKKEDTPFKSAFTAPSKAYLNEPVKFNSNSTGYDYLSWDFGDGSISSEPNPEHKYTIPGDFKVKLVAVKDSETDTYIKIVHINEGRAGYDFSNNSSYGCNFVSFYDNGLNIIDFTNLGYVNPQEVTSEFYTNHEQLYIGGSIFGQVFILKYPFDVIDFQCNHFAIYDTTIVISKKPGSIKTGKLQDLIINGF